MHVVKRSVTRFFHHNSYWVPFVFAVSIIMAVAVGLDAHSANHLSLVLGRQFAWPWSGTFALGWAGAGTLCAALCLLYLIGETICEKYAVR